MVKIPYKNVKLKKSNWFWKRMYYEFFHLNENSYNYCINEYNSLFCNGSDNVLGVMMRGSDYIYAKGHNKQPTVEQVVCVAKKFLKRENTQKCI